MGSKVPEVVSCVNFASKSWRTINAKICERLSEAFQALKAGSCHEHRVLAQLFIFVLLQRGEKCSVVAGLSLNDSHYLALGFFVVFMSWSEQNCR